MTEFRPPKSSLEPRPKLANACVLPAWVDAFPTLRATNDPVGRRILASASVATVPAGVSSFSEGDACDKYLLCIDGRVRVFKMSMDGREIVLYRVNRGENCAVTTACLLASSDYPASAMVEADTRVAVVPKQDFLEGIAHSRAFRDFALETYSRTLVLLTRLVKCLAFDPLELRIAQHLLDHADRAGTVRITHQDLASELGTVREVVTRCLSHFKAQRCIEIQRGLVTITDRRRLSELSGLCA